MKVVMVTLAALCCALGMALAFDDHYDREVTYEYMHPGYGSYGYGGQGYGVQGYGKSAGGNFLPSPILGGNIGNQGGLFGGIFELIIFLAVILPLLQDLV